MVPKILEILLVFFLLSPTKIPAQTVLSSAGARNEGLAGQSAVTRDEWSLWRNPAGLTHTDAYVAAFGAGRVPIINVPSRSAMLSLNARAGCFATGVSAFGDDLYNEHVLSLAFAHRIGITSIGIRTDVFQLSIDGNEVKRAVGVTIGGITSIGGRLMIGAVARNVNLPEWAKGRPLPVVLNAGLLFIPSENFSAIAEVEKNTDLTPTIKAAMEYSLRKKFFARTGFNLFPETAFGGIGFRLWRLGFDYSLRWGYIPGYFQSISVSVKANKKSK